MSKDHYHKKENYEGINRIVSWVNLGVLGTILQKLETLETYQGKSEPQTLLRDIES